jgi:hypothetical protein
MPVSGAARAVLAELGFVPAAANDRVETEWRAAELDAIEPWIADPSAAEGRGWETARVRLAVELEPLRVRAEFERFGVPLRELLIPPAWTPVASSGRLEAAVRQAIAGRAAGQVTALPRLALRPNPAPPSGLPAADDLPFIPDVPVSCDPGSGNQNETTIGIFRDGTVVGGWNDNRTGVYHVGFARSTDFGLTWLPDTLMIDPTYSEDGDPVICVDDEGTIYYFWLSFSRSPASGDIILTKSFDRGASWGPMVNLTPGTPGSLDDKPWVTIDGANVFLTWYEAYSSNALKFKRSPDRGATWSAGVIVGSGGNGTFPFRGTDSTVYVGWGMQDIGFNKSTDMGATWTGQRTIISCPWSPGSPPWRMNNIPSFGTSLDRTKLYVVFADSRRAANQTDVFFSRSTDEGATWLTPVRVNDTQDPDATLQFYPWLAVDPYDRLHVVWHDTRAGDNRIAQYYSYSTDQGLTWSENYRVSDTAVYASTFIGDYNACAADSHRVYALWCDARTAPANPDVFHSQALHIGTEYRDVGVVAILAPGDTVEQGEPVIPTAVVRNYGTAPETFPVRLEVEPGTVRLANVTLAAGATDTVEFEEWTPDEPGRFALRCSTELTGDQNPANDLVADTTLVIPGSGIAEPGRPARFDLTLSAPSPTRGPVRLAYSLPSRADIRLDLYSADGRRVRRLASGNHEPGRYSVEARLPAGGYFARLQSPGRTVTHRFIVADR